MERLRWQCRRGMLELDLLLQGFLDGGYRALSTAERQAFRTLLDYPDQVLLEWMMGRERPVDKEIAGVVDRIRASVPD